MSYGTMGNYRLTQDAKADLRRIYNHGLVKVGRKEFLSFRPFPEAGGSNGIIYRD